MTKVNKKDATKELAAGASKVLDKASRMRKSADALMQSLRKMEARFTKEEEERAAQKRREEQQKVLLEQLIIRMCVNISLPIRKSSTLLCMTVPPAI